MHFEYETSEFWVLWRKKNPGLRRLEQFQNNFELLSPVLPAKRNRIRKLNF